MPRDKIFQTEGTRFVSGLQIRLEHAANRWADQLAAMGRCEYGERVRVTLNQQDVLVMPVGDFPAFAPYMFDALLVVGPGHVVEIETPDGWVGELVDGTWSGAIDEEHADQVWDAIGLRRDECWGI